MHRLDVSPSAAPLEILATVVAANSVPHRGFLVHVGMNSTACQSSSLCENRRVVVQAADDGALRLNEQRIECAAPDGVLKMIFRTRAPRLIYVKADRGAAFKQDVALIDKVPKHVDHVNVDTLDRGVILLPWPSDSGGRVATTEVALRPVRVCAS